MDIDDPQLQPQPDSSATADPAPASAEAGSSTNGNSSSNPESQSQPQLIHTQEGKVTLEHGSCPQIFYNPIQEVNRDVSILGIDTFIKQEKKENATVLEAMAASGIRSIRYAKEIPNLSSVIANDYSREAIASITKNSELNGVQQLVIPSFMDASALMHSQHNTPLIVDLDPYGTPIPYLDAAVQSVQDGGLLLVTATDMAVLAGNTPETCYAKYGSMSLKSNACHEIALRILVHAVQGFANRYGRHAEPLVSLKIDFYARLLFRVTKSAKKCKNTVTQTSMVFQCTGCHTLTFQPLATKSEDKEKGWTKYHFAHGPTAPQKCSICNSTQHLGGPIWTGPIHDRSFISSMLDNLGANYSYFRTHPRIQGMLTMLLEELDVPLFYSTSQTVSVLKCNAIPIVKLRSAFLNAGYEVSASHTGPNTLKTNAPPTAIWTILATWATTAEVNGGLDAEKALAKLSPNSVGHAILSKFSRKELGGPEGLVVDFSLHPRANPDSRSKGVLRYQVNPGPNWGPGQRGAYDANKSASGRLDKRIENQNKKKRQGRKRRRKNEIDNVTETEKVADVEMKSVKESC